MLSSAKSLVLATLMIGAGLGSGRVEGAFLVGTQVTGTLAFNGGSTNYFDPAVNFVPSGFSNKAGGPTVTIAEPAVEFGFADNANTDTANLTDTQLIVGDVSNASASPFKLTFKDSAFIGATLVQVSNSFANLNASLSGDTITLDVAGFSGAASYSATFDIIQPSAVPEPSSLALCGIAGLTGLGYALRRNRRLA